MNPITRMPIMVHEFNEAVKSYGGGCAHCDKQLTFQKARAGQYRITSYMDVWSQKIGLEIYCETCAVDPNVINLLEESA